MEYHESGRGKHACRPRILTDLAGISGKPAVQFSWILQSGHRNTPVQNRCRELIKYA